MRPQEVAVTTVNYNTVNRGRKRRQVALCGGSSSKDAVVFLMLVYFYCFNQNVVNTANMLTMEVNQDTAEFWFLATSRRDPNQHWENICIT